MRHYLFICLALFALLRCEQQPSTETAKAETVAMMTSENGLPDEWYQGKAEVNTYDLVQNRYQNQHPGEAVLIFVTEDFLTDKQVKNERYQNPNSTSVLKTNYLRRFTTGFYDYAIMTSVFTPVETQEYPHTMKVTTSVQDWCGQAFMQLNLDGNRYQTQLRSYFEQEGDENDRVPVALLEDELFNRIRMGPERLPTGDIDILPGTAHARLKHEPFAIRSATVTLEPYSGDEFSGTDLLAYTLVFAQTERALQIVFERESPHRIQGWTDAYPSVFDDKVRRTVAKRTETKWMPYWKQNNAADTTLRADFGLKGF